MNERERFLAAVEAILADPDLADLHADVARVRDQLADEPEPLRAVGRVAGPGARLVWMQVTGHLRAGQRPSLREGLERPAAPVPALPPAPEAPYAPDRPVTFVYLADPQPNGSASDDNNPGARALGQLSGLLNDLPEATWPTNFGLSCGGQKIGPIDAIVFGGDLCQAGGGYNIYDQLYYSPGSYHGGWELEFMRYVFDQRFTPVMLWWAPNSHGEFHTAAPRSIVDRVYWGLGNHDIQTEDVPGVPWSYGCLDAKGPVEDYWRWQMWNFICQMHGYTWLVGPFWDWCEPNTTMPPRVPVDDIDGTDISSDWKRHSFNYRVDLGPVDLYQLHYYGGDTGFGRAGGMDWLRAQLERGGVTRPVIIVQHLTFQTNGDWPPGDKDALLDVLRQYNVVALLTGHNHDPLADPPRKAPSEDGILNAMDECRPGTAQAVLFAVVRVTPTTLDYAQSAPLSPVREPAGPPPAVRWTYGFEKSIAMQLPWALGYTAITSATQEGANYVWAYRADHGHAAILRVADDGRGFETTYFEEQWKKDYTSFAGFDLEGTAYVWAYQTTGAGTVRIERIDPGGSGFTETFEYDWDTKYTSFVACPHPLDGSTYLWAYGSGTQNVTILRLLPGGAGFAPTYGPKTWDGGYTGFASLRLPGGAFLWAYNAVTGRVCILEIQKGGGGFSQPFTYGWDTGFTSFASFELDGRAYVWAYHSTRAMVCILEILPGGTGFVQRSISRWRRGYDGVAGFNLPAPDLPPACVLAYSAADARIAINHIEKDGTGFVEQT